MSAKNSAAFMGLILSIFTRVLPAEENNYMNVYVGTYMRTAEKGIFKFRLDMKTGEVSGGELAGKTINPSFLTLHPDGKLLYAVSEVENYNGAKSGAVSAFAVDKENGKLTLLNQQSSGGGGPCHLTIDSAGKNLLVANYGGGSVEVVPILLDGKLKEPSCVVLHKDPEAGTNPRQARCHSINLDATQKYAFVADLGLDCVFFYKFDSEKGILIKNEPEVLVLAKGAGPRHLAWHTSGKFAYVINELNSTITVTAFNAEKGTLSELQTLSTLPEGYTGKSDCAEVVVHPSGKFLYGSNRGHDSIVIYAIEPLSGKLTMLGHEPTQGKVPRNFCIDPTGKYLLAANQESNNIVVFSIDEATGLLKPTGQKVKIPAPVCIKFLPVD